MVYGFWGQNIGNAFFNIGGRWIAEQLFPGQVAEILDQPGYRTFHRKSSGNPRNDFGLLAKVDVDYIILQGPMLTRSFRNLWEPTFKELKKRGTKIILLSAAFFHYDEEEVASAREFIKEIEPCIISTRDRDTYQLVKDLAPFVYDGIDSAFFVPKAYRPVALDIPPYVCLNFDQYPEPNFEVVVNGEPPKHAYEKSFEALGRKWFARQPKLLKKFAGKGQWQCYLAAMFDFRKLPREIDGLEVIRTDHRFNPHITWKVYQHPNAVASDEPFTYFSLYANAALTLSDRVHACVATLAYGRPAMLYHPTPRARLFQRVGLNEIRDKPCSLDLNYLETERQNQLKFLQSSVLAQ